MLRSEAMNALSILAQKPFALSTAVEDRGVEACVREPFDFGLRLRSGRTEGLSIRPRPCDCGLRSGRTEGGCLGFAPVWVVALARTRRAAGASL